MAATKWFIFVFGCLVFFVFYAVYLSETRYVHDRPVFIFSVKDGWASTSNGFYRVASSAPLKARKWCMLSILKPKYDVFSYIEQYHCFSEKLLYLPTRQVREKKERIEND